MVDDDRELAGRQLLEAPVAVGAGGLGQRRLLLGRGRDPAVEPRGRQLGMGCAQAPRARPDDDPGPSVERVDARPATASGPSSRPRRWWSSNAAASAASSGSAGARATRPTTVRASSSGQRRDSAEHRDQLVRGQQVEQRRGDDEVGAGEIRRGQPGDVGLPAPRRSPRRRPGGSATASSSSVSSRSCTTQCCGPASRGASQRPIAPLPPPRSWTTTGPRAGRCSREARGELRRARRRVGRLAQVEPRPGCDDGHRPAAPRRPRTWSPASGAASAPLTARPGAGGRAGRPRRARPQRVAERHGIAGRDQQAGPRAVLPVAERLAHPADVGGEHRHAAGQRLGEDHAVRLGAGGEHEQVRGRVRASSSAPMRAPGSAPAAVQPRARGGARPRRGPRRGRGCPRTRSARAGPRRGERVEQHVVALVRGHRRHAEQRAAVRAARRECRGLHAGLGHVDAVGGQSVQLAEPPPGPGAGRDDGGGGREDRRARAPAPRRAPGAGGRAACAPARPAAAGAPPARGPRARPTR